MLIAQTAIESAAGASSNLLQYGAIGACLVLAIITIGILGKFVLNAFKSRVSALEIEINKKDVEIKRLNEVRAEAAVKVVELAGALGVKMDGLTEVIKKMHKGLARVLRKLNADSGGLDDNDL